MATGWDACMEEGHRRWLAWSGTGRDGYGLPEGCRWVLNPLWGYPHLDTKRCHTSLGSLSLDPTAFPLSAPAGKRTHVEKVIGFGLTELFARSYQFKHVTNAPRIQTPQLLQWCSQFLVGVEDIESNEKRAHLELVPNPSQSLGVCTRGDLKHSSRPSRVNNLLDEAYWIVCYAVTLHVRKMAAGTKRVRDDKEEVCVWDRNRCFMIQETSEERRAVKGSTRRKTETVSGQAEQRAGKWKQETGSSEHYWW
ncbi:hypothetical protein B0H14DRAFT_2616872 [Mycena olivaceomarginata]|nr:hypothetical protein B0H14DRAFT_2616872 [Mycena olivaceomarginata]